MHHREQWHCHVNWAEHAELDELITERRKQGISFSLIALEIGRRGIMITRNAIIGRAQRMGIKGMTQPIARKPTDKPRPAFNGVTRQRKPPLKLAPPPAEVEFLNLPIVELGPNQCRYPNRNAKEFFIVFCGQPTFGSPWCPTHHRLCYVKAK